MIRGLTIHGYRSLDGLNLPNLGRVNLIVGTGGSGKTNLLEAAFLFCSNGNAGSLAALLNLRGVLIKETPVKEVCDLFDWFWTVTPNSGVSFSISGRWNDIERRVEVTRHAGSNGIDLETCSAVAWEVGGRDSRDCLASYDLVSRQGGEVYEGKIVLKPRRVEIAPAVGPRLPAVFVSARERGQSYELSAAWSTVEDAGESAAVLELVRLLDADIEDIRLGADASGKAYLRVGHARLGRVPLEFLGGGLGKAISIASRMIEAENGVLLIDEFDGAIHVGAQTGIIKFLLEAAKRHNIQLFVSTHSIETIDAFLDSYESALWSSPTDFQILQLRQAAGQTHAKSFDAEEVRTLREDIGADLRQPA